MTHRTLSKHCKRVRSAIVRCQILPNERCRRTYRRLCLLGLRSEHRSNNRLRCRLQILCLPLNKGGDICSIARSIRLCCKRLCCWDGLSRKYRCILDCQCGLCIEHGTQLRGQYGLKRRQTQNLLRIGVLPRLGTLNSCAEFCRCILLRKRLSLQCEE